MVRAVKNLPANARGLRDTGSITESGRYLEKKMAICSSILAWELPWQRSLEGHSPWGCEESDMAEQLLIHSYRSLQRIELSSRRYSAGPS